MILADLPYAHETANKAKSVAWFFPDDSKKLAIIIKNILNNNLSNFSEVKEIAVDSPHTLTWQEMFEEMQSIK